MELFEWVIKTIFVSLCFLYLFGPIYVWFSQKLPESYKFEILDSVDFISNRSHTFKELHKLILSNNFYYVGSSVLKMSNSSMYFSIYYNHNTKRACTLSSIFSQSINSTQIEFTQKYSNGSLVNVNNNPIIPVYPNWDKKINYRFPSLNNFNDLLVVADKIFSINNGNVVNFLVKGEEFRNIERHLTEELLWLISQGWVSNSITNGKRRYTVKGAILLTWRLLWPSNIIFNYIDTSKSKKALNNS